MTWRSSRTRRPVSRLLALSGLLIGSLAAPAAPARQTGDEWRTEVKALLHKRATAVAKGDEEGFMSTVAGATQSFRAAQRTWFKRIRSLPLGLYELNWIEDEFGDLARDHDRTQYPAGVHIIQVKERYGFRGYDKRPSGEDVFYTVAKTPGAGWSIVGDEDVEDIALQSNRNLWDFGEVRKTESDGIMVIYHPAQPGAVPSIMSMSKAARRRAQQGWPYPWNDPIVIMVPNTVEELERILQTTFDLSSFVAFAVSSVNRTKSYSLDGHRIFLHWPNLKKYGQSFQTVVLAHEFVHLATRDIAGPYLNSFFDEGVALLYGEGGGSTTEIRRRVRARTLPRKLIPEWFFLAGSRNEIFLAYEEAASFCQFLSARSDRGGCARAYKTLGTIDPVSAGTGRYHADRVVRGMFGASLDDLERAWADRVYRENR